MLMLFLFKQSQNLLKTVLELLSDKHTDILLHGNGYTPLAVSVI